MWRRDFFDLSSPLEEKKRIYQRMSSIEKKRWKENPPTGRAPEWKRMWNTHKFTTTEVLKLLNATSGFDTTYQPWAFKFKRYEELLSPNINHTNWATSSLTPQFSSKYPPAMNGTHQQPLTRFLSSQPLGFTKNGGKPIMTNLPSTFHPIIISIWEPPVERPHL